MDKKETSEKAQPNNQQTKTPIKRSAARSKLKQPLLVKISKVGNKFRIFSENKLPRNFMK